MKEKIENFLQSTPIELLLVDSKSQETLAEYYYLVFGKSMDCSYCPASVQRVVDEIKSRLSSSNFNLYTKQLMYKLKESKRVYSRRLGIHITAANITPGNGDALLAENPENIQHFETYPENWEERAAIMKKKLFPEPGEKVDSEELIEEAKKKAQIEAAKKAEDEENERAKVAIAEAEAKAAAEAEAAAAKAAEDKIATDAAIKEANDKAEADAAAKASGKQAVNKAKNQQ